jgi:hypothetical protein
MKAMTQSALAVAALAVTTSLAACDQGTPGKDSMSSRSTPGTSSTAGTSSTMTPAPAPSAATDSSQKMAAAETSPKAAETSPKAPGNDDAALTAQVKTALQSDPALRAQSIDVDTKNATVTLTGAVDSAASKAKANEVAAGVNGVAAVVDHLTVKAS